jgi:hypothetical protein
MFKALSRGFQKKQDYLITVKMVRVYCTVEEDCQVQVEWQRGPTTEKSNKYDLNNIEVDVEMTDVFSKVSSFYSKDGGQTFEPKLCHFHILLFGPEDEEGKRIASKEINMAPFVNHTDSPQKIEFEDSDMANVAVDLEWTISSDTTGADDITRMASTSSLDSGLMIEGQ